MKIAAVACFSNELALAGAFRDQLETFFDKSYLVSHNTYDKTADLFLDSNKFAVNVVKDPIFRQAELVSVEMVRAFEEGADWVIFLDFDEFLPLSGRGELEVFLNEHEEKDVVSWRWQTIYPETLGHPEIFKRKFFTIPDAAIDRKVIISKRAYEKDPNLLVSHGSHEQISNKKMDVHFEEKFKLIHLIIHGLDHFKQKILIRQISSYGPGFFDDRIEEYISSGSISEEVLRNYALTSGIKDFPDYEASIFDFDFPYITSQYVNEKESAIDSLFGAIYLNLLTKDVITNNNSNTEEYMGQLTAKAMMQSRSWKITRPLRAINRLVKAIKSLKS